MYRYANNTGVESLSWLSDGQLLAVGCQKRNVQIYDLRVSGTNAPPISVFAHSEAVSGIVSDGNCPTKSVFATFGKNAGEPVKIWDARMMDSSLGEIRVVSSFGGGSDVGVSAIAWSVARPGVLSVAVGNSIRTYDTKTPGSRSLPVGVSYLDGSDEDESFVQDIAFQPQIFCGGKRSSVILPADDTTLDYNSNPFEFYPHRSLVVSSKGQIEVMPESHAAPLAVSKRDGRVAHGLGGNVWVGPTTDGPSAMEGKLLFASEDISSRMMRRARCLHAFRYSTNASDNVRMLEEEKAVLLSQQRLHLQSSSRKKSSSLQPIDFHNALSDIDQLIRSWRWIAHVESLSSEQRGDDNINSNNSSMNFSSSHSGFATDETPWQAKGLIDAGVMKLLRMSSRDVADENNNWMDNKSTSDTLSCDEYDSPMRR